MSENKTKVLNNRPWTEAEVDQLKAAWARGESASGIAQSLGRDRNSILGKIHVLRRKGEPIEPRRTGRTALSRGERLEISNRRRARAGKALIAALPPVAAVVPLASGSVSPKRLSIVEIGPGQCRWPYGNGPFHFCGHTAVLGKPYCLDHAQIAYQPATPADKQPVKSPQEAVREEIDARKGTGSRVSEKPATEQIRSEKEIA